ncbi:MAG: transporter substrate-binding domain-containing protein [Prolixibacteraceae bacterium]|nr:transporter substrate-binding domain-containing protein [Prolixibacteraceae bacterium]
MKKSFFFQLILISVIWFYSCNDEEPQNDYSLQFYTEQYKPFNYLEAGEVTGLAPEVLKEICRSLSIDYEVKVFDWNEAYSKTLETSNAVLFSTVLNAERKDLFKWAGPLASIDWFFYSKAGNPLKVNSLEDAKNIGKIGVINDYSITQYLEGKGFSNLIYIDDIEEAFSKLLNGEIDLFPSDRLTTDAILDEMGYSPYNVKPQFRVLTDLIYFAFNKNIPDEVVSDFQHEIDCLKESGTLKLLSQEFLQTSDVPGSLLIYTEEYPPLTFLNSYGEVSGFGTNIVREIMKRNGIYEKINLNQWRIGYELALNNPNFCLFTMDRTEIRENLFQWVGPLGANKTYLFTKRESGITINSIDDAKKLSSIGTVSSWFSDQYLRELGFSNIVSDGDPLLMTDMLMKGEVDAFVCSSLTFSDILEELNFNMSQVTASYELMSSDFYIAFSLNTPESMVSQWQQTFNDIKNDGTYESIELKWFPVELK